MSEWAALNFPRAEIILRVSLGALDPTVQDSNLDASELKRLGVWRRWADALIIEPRLVHLVEAKIKGNLGALEQLDVYAELLPLTPELAHLRGREVWRHLVWVIPDPVVQTLARRRGILVHEFRPPWVDEYLAELSPRERTPAQTRGLETVLELDEDE